MINKNSFSYNFMLLYFNLVTFSLKLLLLLFVFLIFFQNVVYFFEESFKKICLPQSDIQSLAGNIGLVVGWRDSNRNASGLTGTNMRYISLSIMNNTECAIRYAQYSENFEDSIVITPTEFCSQSRTMNDVCEGDSGGPFISINSFNRCTLVAIVAFAPSTNCGQSNLPGVYMRISSYTEWITSNIKITRSKS
ncbi:venom peptide isomerase heavy chain-like [Glossina fuscipes]|uniref:Venom peptide isomerase heavy chain-like n=1 Tax=Glossina fuscipes TaxID=7396 RepID=A0A9C5YT28_9MUSC|nr:venom peptide isomerase heavy chain-like [Glossina fuscipes]